MDLVLKVGIFPFHANILHLIAIIGSSLFYSFCNEHISQSQMSRPRSETVIIQRQTLLRHVLKRSRCMSALVKHFRIDLPPSDEMEKRKCFLKHQKHPFILHFVILIVLRSASQCRERTLTQLKIAFPTDIRISTFIQK